MRTTTVLLLLLLALCGGLVGCGGSGSSGFDVTSLAENAVIDEALASGQCGESGTLLICPAGAVGSVMPTPGQTPGANPNGGREVSFDAAPSDALSCTFASESGSCVYELSFSASGLPAEATYHAAVRELEPSGPWQVGGRLEPATAAHFVALVDIPPGSGKAQFAVLVFTESDDGVEGSTETLAQTGASFAFLSRPLSVNRNP